MPPERRFPIPPVEAPEPKGYPMRDLVKAMVIPPDAHIPRRERGMLMAARIRFFPLH